MANIGTLTANLRLESAAFMRDMTRASNAVASNTAQMRKHMRAVETASRGVERAFGQLRGAALALGGALAVRQFTQFTKAAIDGADALAKQAKQLDINAREFQRYRIEGELAGVATEKLESGIGAFTKRVGELRAGTGTLVTILDKSNVALKNQLLAATSTEDGLRIMLAAIRDAGSAFDKTALAAAAFGRQAGQAMVLLADDMGTLDAEMVNFVVRSDAVLAAGERLNDEFTLLQSAFSAGFDSAIIEGLTGSVDASAESMRAARETGEQFGRTVGLAMRGVAEAAQFIGRNMREIVTVIGSLIALKAAGMFLGIAAAVVKFSQAMIAAAKAGVLVDAILSKSILGTIAKLLIAVGGAAAMWQTFGKEAEAAIKDTEKAVRGASEGIGDGIATVTDNVTKSTQAMRLEAVQSKQLIAALQRSKKEYLELAAAIEIENEAQRLGVDLTTAQGKAWVEAARDAQRYKAELDTVVKAEEDRLKEQERLAEQQRELMLEPFKNAIRGIQSSFTDMFESVFSGGVNSFSDLASSVKRIFIRLAAEIATLLVFRPVVGSVLGSVGLGSIASGLGVGGGGFGSISSLFGGGGGGGLFGGGGGFSEIPVSMGDILTNGGGIGGGLGSLFQGEATAGVQRFLTQSIGLDPNTAFSINQAFGNLSSFGNVAGSFAANLALNAILGNRGVGADIGSSIGAIAGSFLPIPGGTIIGAAAGNIIGGMFGGGGFNNGALTEGFTGVNNGRLSVTGFGQLNGGNEAGRPFLDTSVDFINSLVDQGILSLNTGIRFDTKFGNFRTFTGPTPRNADDPVGGFLGVGQDPEKVLVDTIRNMVIKGFAKVDDPAVLDAIRNSAATTLAAFAQELQPFSFAGVAAARLPFLQAAGTLAEFVRAQQLSPASTLSPTERFVEAQRQFGDLLGRVRGGEIGLTQNLTQAAGTLLNLGRENFGATVSFANLEKSTLNSLLSVAETFTQDDFIDAQVEATRQQTQVIADGNAQLVDAVEDLKREIQLLGEKVAA